MFFKRRCFALENIQKRWGVTPKQSFGNKKLNSITKTRFFIGNSNKLRVLLQSKMWGTKDIAVLKKNIAFHRNNQKRWVVA